MCGTRPASPSGVADVVVHQPEPAMPVPVGGPDAGMETARTTGVARHAQVVHARIAGREVTRIRLGSIAARVVDHEYGAQRDALRKQAVDEFGEHAMTVERHDDRGHVDRGLRFACRHGQHALESVPVGPCRLSSGVRSATVRRGRSRPSRRARRQSGGFGADPPNRLDAFHLDACPRSRLVRNSATVVPVSQEKGSSRRARSSPDETALRRSQDADASRRIGRHRGVSATVSEDVTPSAASRVRMIQRRDQQRDRRRTPASSRS